MNNPQKRTNTAQSHHQTNIKAGNISNSQGIAIGPGAQVNYQAAPIKPSAATAPTPPTDFVGRADELKRISDALTTGHSAAITALQGMGGIGKTALAQMLAERLKTHFSGGIFWADLARHNGSVEPILRAWGAFCGADLSRESDSNVLSDRVRGLLAQRQHEKGPLLAIMDDVRPDVGWLTAVGILKSGLPADTSLLVTTREEGIAAELTSHIWRLDVLTEAEGQEMLTELVKVQSVLEPAEVVQRLLKALGHLPLAIRLAAALLKRQARKSSFRLANLVEEIEASAAKVLDRENSTIPGLVATFQISYDGLDQEEQRLFRYLSVYSDPLLTVDHLAGLLAMESATVETSLDRLVESALLDWDQEVEERYRLHLLLRQYSYERLSEVEDVTAIHRAAATYLRGVVEGEGVHAEEMLEEVDQWQKAEVWEIFIQRANGLVGSLYRLGYWSEIEQQLIQAQSKLPHLGEKNESELDAMLRQNLGIIANSQAHWDDAIGYYEQSLETFEQMGNIHAMAHVYNNLGTVYKAKGEWDKAIGFYEQSLETKELADDIHGMAQTCNNLGLVYQAKGEWDKARIYYEQSLKTYEQMGDIHDMAQTHGNLGNTYQAKGEWDKAVDYYQQALETYEQVDDIRGIAQIHMGLGAVYKAKGEWNKAASYYQQALETYEQVGDIRGMAQTDNNLGLVYQAKGEWNKAIGYYEHALETFEQVGDIHAMAQTYNNLGLVYKARGEWDKAIDYYEQDLKISKQVGDIHGTAQTRGNLGIVYQAKGEWDKAIGYYEQSLETKEQVGDIHGMAQTHVNLGIVYQAKEEWDNAIGYYQQAKETFEQMGDIHGRAQIHVNLGNFYQIKGELDKAISYYEQSLEMYEQVGDIHGMATARTNIGILLLEQNRQEEAQPLFALAFLVFAQIGTPEVEMAGAGLGLACGSAEAAKEYMACMVAAIQDIEEDDK